MLVTPFVQYFGTVPDPRIDRTKQHRLLDILVIALCVATERRLQRVIVPLT